jgi:hypothetical protein
VSYTYNLSIWETEAGRQHVLGKSGLPGDTLSQKGKVKKKKNQIQKSEIPIRYHI